MSSWEQVPSTNGVCTAWYKRNITYQKQANALQNLDIWIPATAGDTNPPFDGHSSSQKGIWIVYIHGGAWRDPEVDASTFSPTVKHLLNNEDAVKKIAGIASINYSLSPYPSHPRNPSPPSDPQLPVDPSRQARHPDHLVDVRSALVYLQNQHRFDNRYILVGHSCGATLAFQACIGMGSVASTSGFPDFSMIPKPQRVVGLNGLYNLFSLVTDPGPRHEHLAPIYGDFVSRAFPKDKDLLKDIAPIRIAEKWAELIGVEAILAQSRDDTLVPYSQTQEMLEKMRAGCGPDAPREYFREVEITGDHNEIWENGTELAKIIADVLRA